MVVYADVLFITNLLINYLIIYTAARALGRVSYIRIIIAAIIASVYSVIVFYLNLTAPGSIAANVICAALTVKIAFAHKSYRQFIGHYLLFYLISFAYGGAVFGLFLLGGGGLTGSIIRNNVFYFNISLFKLILLATICCALIQLGSYIYKRRQLFKKLNIDFTVCYLGKQIALTGFVDTGNTLREPLSGKSVIVVEEEYVRDLFSYDEASRVRFIPYSALGTDSGIMTGFVPDYVKIGDEIIDDVIIGIYNKKLTEDRSYNALLSAEFHRKEWG